jgi:hypothetical protein
MKRLYDEGLSEREDDGITLAEGMVNSGDYNCLLHWIVLPF